MSDEEIMAMDSNNMKFFVSMVKYSKDKNKMKEISEKYFKDFFISPQVPTLPELLQSQAGLQRSTAIEKMK